MELLEYGEQGLVHISEIAPGRIRNIRDYVSEDRQIICKVLRIDQQKGHIDLSLRRVNSHQRVAKLEEIKQENKAETLVQNLAKKVPEYVPKRFIISWWKKSSRNIPTYIFVLRMLRRETPIWKRWGWIKISF